MSYYDKMQVVLDYIEQHIQDDISPTSLANITHFSVTHFYRLFNGMIGDTVKNYIQKRKLSHSAIELIKSDRRILDIAIDFGYKSQEVYTRAFSKMFGTSPGKYRLNQNDTTLHQKVILTKHNPIPLASEHYNPRIIISNTLLAIGMKTIVNPGSEAIKKMWKRFSDRQDEITHRHNQNQVLGICEYMPDITEESEFTYFAGVQVSKTHNIPNNMVAKSISSQVYAVFSHFGCLSELKETYRYIYGYWIPSSDYKLAPADTIEAYYVSEKNKLDIYIPILYK